MSIINYGIENSSHQCQQCGMKFFNSHQLLNHVKKFCTTAGLNSLSAFTNHHQNNNQRKLKNYGANSLGSMKYQPDLNASQLAKEARNMQNFKEQLLINRPYSNNNAHQNKQQNDQPQLEQNYARSIVKKVKLPPHIKNNGYGSRTLQDSQVSIKPLQNFGKQGQFEHKYQNDFISPPSQNPTLFVKNRLAPSVLNKSNSSIAQMTLSQRKDYATQKLIELDSIQSMYDKSGGASMDFRKNLQKMKKFYKKMLQQQKLIGFNNQQTNNFISSRVQTPISRLRNIQDDKKVVKSKLINDSLDNQIKLNEQKNKSLENRQQNKLFIPSSGNPNNRRPNQNNIQNFPFQTNPFMNPYQYNGYNQMMPSFSPQPQIIMLPPYNQDNNNKKNSRVTSQVSQQIKYYQRMIEMKNEQNNKLMELLLQNKKGNNQMHSLTKTSKFKQSKTSQFLNSPSKNAYHFETPMDGMPLSEEKILLALQRQQLDELRLLSSLPPQLQQIKMQSVMKLIQQRTQLQKQILKQKVRRLQQQQRNQQYEQNIRIDKDNWANQQRKKLIGYQMDNVINQLKKKVDGQDSDYQQIDQQQFNNQAEGE